MNKRIIVGIGILSLLAIWACNSSPDAEADKVNLKEEHVGYTADSTMMISFIVYNKADSSKRPAVIVIPEWWGLVEYPKERARQLAALGYVAMAIDVYGNGQTAETPDSAGKAAMPFYQDPMKAKIRIDAAIEKLKSYPQVDPNKIAAIGYCFGGGILLNSVRLGEPDIKGAVSFHGSLLGTPADKNLLQSKILVCHGAQDEFVPMSEVEAFKHQMDSIHASYSIKIYDSATHAFTNPGATITGQKYSLPIAYNGAADTASWKQLKRFLKELF